MFSEVICTDIVDFPERDVEETVATTEKTKTRKYIKDTKYEMPSDLPF